MLRKFSSVALSCLLLSGAIVNSAVAVGVTGADQVTDIDSSNTHRASFLDAQHFERYLKHAHTKKAEMKEKKKKKAAASAVTSDSSHKAHRLHVKEFMREGPLVPTPTVVDDVDVGTTSTSTKKNSIIDAVSKRNQKIHKKMHKKKAMQEENDENVRSGKSSKTMQNHSPTIVERSGKSSKAKHTHSPTIKSSHTTKAPSTAKTNQPTMSHTEGGSKSGESKTSKSKTRKSKKHRSKTHKSSKRDDPTLEPTEADSIAPTHIPPGALYYESFEQATFPDSPEWSVTTSEDGTSIGDSRGRKLEEEEKPSIYWALTTDEAATGVYSIKSPDLSNDDHTPRSAFVTLTTGDDWGEGYLTFSLLWDLNYPGAVLLWYVDDEFYEMIPADPSEGWESFQIYLQPGEHKVTWEYAYNPEDYDDPPEAGVVFIDAIYFTLSLTSDPTSDPTMEPNPNPTGLPTPPPSTIAPTSTPAGAVYFNSFEQGFLSPGLDPEWSTVGDAPWERTNQQAASGVFSIRSPELSNVELTPGASNVILQTNPAWGAGSLFFSVYPATEMPFDDFVYFVDGVQRGGGPNTINPTGFEEREIQLDPGPHEITFAYRYNPIPLDQFPPEQPGRIGAVFLDDVYFVSSGNSPAPTPSVIVPPCVPLDPNPYNFEVETFPLPPWSTGGDGEWALSTEQAFNGTTSLKSPDLDGSAVASVSNATLQICDDFLGGVLRFQAIASVLPPSDIFVVYVDGVTAAQLVDVNEWTDVNLGLEPGPHRVDFSYQYNIFGVNPLPPSPPRRQGAVWIDAVSLSST